MAVKNLRELFIDELKDVCDAETRLTKALPKLAKAASSKQLVKAFQDHLKQTEGHLKRVENILESLEGSAAKKTCKAMVGLLAEGAELMNEGAPPELKDLMLIAAAQKVEHYEIATYGTLCAWGRELGEDKAVKQLEAILGEESAADALLTQIALPLTASCNEMDEEEDEEVMTTGRRGNSKRR